MPRVRWYRGPKSAGRVVPGYYDPAVRAWSISRGDPLDCPPRPRSLPKLAALFDAMARASAGLPGPEPAMAAKERELLALLQSGAPDGDRGWLHAVGESLRADAEAMRRRLRGVRPDGCTGRGPRGRPRGGGDCPGDRRERLGRGGAVSRRPSSRNSLPLRRQPCAAPSSCSGSVSGEVAEKGCALGDSGAGTMRVHRLHVCGRPGTSRSGHVAGGGAGTARARGGASGLLLLDHRRHRREGLCRRSAFLAASRRPWAG